MKSLWSKLSPLAQYYVKFLSSFLVLFGLLNFLNIFFNNQLFFMVGYIWHFTLMTPGLKEKVMTKKQRFSFLNVIVRVNYYLQLFIKSDRVPFHLGPALVRSIAPLIFIFFLKVVGGSGDFLFAIFGCACFEVAYYFMNKKTISMPPSDPEIPPAIPTGEIFHE